LFEADQLFNLTEVNGRSDRVGCIGPLAACEVQHPCRGLLAGVIERQQLACCRPRPSDAYWPLPL